MKNTVLIATILVLTFVIASTAVLAQSVQINSVSVAETDNFYSPCPGNDVVNVVADVSGATVVLANFSAFAGMDCGSGSDTISLTNTGGTTWQGSCNVSAEAASSDFVGGPIVVVASNGNVYDVNNSQVIVLYRMTTPPEQEGTCDMFGNLTTNMCEVDDFTDVNFVIEIQTNGTCQGEQIGQELPWSDFKTVVLFNFSSINMASEDIGDKLASLGSALSVYITPPGMFGDSYIGVDTNAFAELDTNTTITLYGLPFAVQPAVLGDDPGAITVDSYTLNTPYTIEITCEDIAEDVCEEEACSSYCSDPGAHACTECIDSCMESNGDEIIAQCEADGEAFNMTIPNADLTFTVAHFSQYNVSDNATPTVQINSPSAEDNVTMEYTVNVSANGTGSQISSIKLYINGNLDQEIESTDIFSECSNDDASWTAVTCVFNVIASAQGNTTITVAVTDYGGAAGLSANTSVSPVHVDFCGSTVTHNVALQEDIDCSSQNTGAIILGAANVAFDCAGHNVIGIDTNDYSAFYSSGYDNLTIKNCVISNFVGINILNSEGHKILNNSIARTSGSVQYKGISFSDVNNSNISKNTLRYMEDAGILISRGYNDKITENKIYNSMSGVSLIAATNSVSKNLIKDNQIYNLTAGGGTVCAIYVEDNADQIQGNIIDCGNYSDSNFKGISLYGSNAENNSLSGNDVRGCYYGFDSSGQLNFTIDSDEYYENNYGIYLSSTGGSALWPVIKNSDIHDNGEGITMSGAKASIINTNFNRNAVSSSTGIYVNGSSIAYITNGEFLNNGDYAILDNAPGSVYWTINSAAKCINNSVVIADGNITFDNGTLELNNCLLTIPDGQGGSIQINQTGTISSLDFEVKAVTAYTPEEFNFSESSVVLNLSDNVTTTITVTGMTPESSPSGFTALKGIDITVDSTTEGALVSALIKIFYSDAELTAANIDENSLKIYYYNETAGAWQLEPDQGVDTVNNYVWARVTHLSSYGAFGKGISGGSSGRSGGGGGGGGSFYRRNQTTAITANTVMACQDDWICDVWSECINGMMTRECVLNDYPNCLTAAAKPATQSACTAQPSEASKPAEAATAPKASPIVDTVKQGLAGVANIAGQGMSALTKQVGIGIAILVVIGGLAAYLLLSKK